MSTVQQAVQAELRVWSEYQLNLFGDAAVGKGNRIVIAVAGSGKTSSGEQMVKRVRGSHVYLAFNKPIATELAGRGLNGRTFHSMCYSVVTKARNAKTVDSDKLRRICDAKLTGDDGQLYGSFIQRLVGLARNAGIGCLVDNVDSAWYELIEHHDLQLESELSDMGKALELAQQLLVWSNESTMIDFDDLLYFAVKDGLVLPKFDNVFVDEAQDTNAIQRAIIRKLMKPTSRLFAIGDPAQAIYGFRGADSNSMNLIKEEFNCTEMPLTVSYRCPTAVVEYAKQWVDHIEAAPNAPAGEVVDLNYDWTTDNFKPNDLVVCRTTAPIITLAYRMLKARVPVRVMGREIGQGLKTLIKKMNARDLDTLESKLQAWAERECEKARAKNQDSKVEAINDKCDAILCLIDGLQETDRSVYSLVNVIDKLFADAVNVTVLATIHKSKGLEADRVFWLNSSLCPSQWAKQDWQIQQEKNLCYVATTRAKKSLFLIEEKKEKSR